MYCCSTTWLDFVPGSGDGERKVCGSGENLLKTGTSRSRLGDEGMNGSQHWPLKPFACELCASGGGVDLTSDMVVGGNVYE